MCYNNCKIEIKSCIDGSVSVIRTEGKVVKTSSETCFVYDLDGDSCSFTLKGKSAVQKRLGKQNIELTFVKGENTDCFLEDGDLTGSLPIFTYDLRFDSSGTDGSAMRVDVITIDYSIGEQKIKLEFSAEYNKKVKK